MVYKVREQDSGRRDPPSYAPPNQTDPGPPPAPSRAVKVERLTSLDAFRGFIMIVLAANGFGLYGLSQAEPESQLWLMVDRESFEKLAFHFEHPPWQSNFLVGSTTAGEGNAWLTWKVSFWDLIQPAFMFMVGAAIPFSYLRRAKEGQSALWRGFHAFLRAVVLVLLGVFLSSRGSESTNWIFPNVLAQIGLGYFFVYLISGAPKWAQWTAFGVILVGTTLALQYLPPQTEFNPAAVNASYERGEIMNSPYERWSKNWNALSEFDLWFLNLFPRPEPKNGEAEAFASNSGGYTTLNFVPSMATMLLGVFCGQFLLTAPRAFKTFLILVLCGVICTALGVAAGATCNPIIKRIWTPAWVLFSGGYVIWMLAFSYLLFDVMPLKKLAFPLVVVGMNSILVYMMGQMLKPWIFREVVMTHFDWAIENFLGRLALWTGVNATGEELMSLFSPVIQSTSVALFIWLVCYWLYRQRVFLRI